ncbi:MAG: DUF5661 family protein, partial [Acidimicrobiia bacterium]|nr:DUF5661 family protein [Acidimicrobiia bacterium]
IGDDRTLLPDPIETVDAAAQLADDGFTVLAYTGDDPIVTGKIALAHLNEFPDYYTRLDELEEAARRHWGES